MSSINVLKVTVVTGSEDEELLTSTVPVALVRAGEFFTTYVCNVDLLDEVKVLNINCFIEFKYILGVTNMVPYEEQSIVTELDCMNWVISLKEFDLLWHFDDDIEDCFAYELLSDWQIDNIKDNLAKCKLVEPSFEVFDDLFDIAVDANNSIADTKSRFEEANRIS